MIKVKVVSLNDGIMKVQKVLDNSTEILKNVSEHSTLYKIKVNILDIPEGTKFLLVYIANMDVSDGESFDEVAYFLFKKENDELHKYAVMSSEVDNLFELIIY